MEVVEGVVKNLRHSTNVSGGGSNSSVSTTNEATFEIKNRAITVRSVEALSIKEGDSIKVVGESNKGMLNAFVYKNYRTDVSGGSGAGGNLFLSFITGGMMLFILINFTNPFFGAFPYVLSAILLFPTILGIKGHYKTKSAFKKLENSY
jgi:hypothetical protein